MSDQPANKISIACLPIAGEENPYQRLMIAGLNENAHIVASSGESGKFTGILKTALFRKPDYIHFDWIESFYSRRYLWLTWLNIPWFFFQIFIATKICKIKVVCTLHNLTPHNTKFPALHQYVYGKFLVKTKWIRVFSDSSVKRATQHFNLPPIKFRICPEGDFTTFYTNNTTRKSARVKLKIASGKKVILFFGSISAYKGVENLVRCFNEINQENTTLIIAGRPADRNLVNQLAIMSNENIQVLAESIQPDQVQYYMHAADFVVCPFEQIENSGSVILAMGFKKLIVAPDMGMLASRLSVQTGFLYLPGQLKATLLKALNTFEAEIEKIGEANFQSLKQYHWSDFGKFYV